MLQALSDGTTSVVVPELTAFQQTILAILAEEARDGLAIKRELDTDDESDVNHERLYPNLDTLVEMSSLGTSGSMFEMALLLRPLQPPSSTTATITRTDSFDFIA